MKRTVWRVVAIGAMVALALAGTGCASKVVTSPSATPINSVTASGQGSVYAAPDVATMTFGAETTGAKAKATLDAASKTAEKIIAALKKQGVDADDIQTSGVSLYPMQDNRNGKVVVTGYSASISVSAKLRDIEKVGDVIEAASNAGANSVNGPTFEISEDSDQRALAIEKAVAAAKKNAEAMAKAAGKSVGGVIQITASNVSVPVPMMRAEAFSTDMAGAKVPVEAGQVEVTGDVTVMYELK